MLGEAASLQPHSAKWAGLYADFAKREKSNFVADAACVGSDAGSVRHAIKTKNAWFDILSARRIRGEYRRTDTPASHRGDHP